MSQEEISRYAPFVEECKIHVECISEGLLSQDLTITLLKSQRDAAIQQLDLAVTIRSMSRDQLEIAKERLIIAEEDLDNLIGQEKEK